MTSFKMDQEEIKTDAPVKPAKTRAPRKNSRSKASVVAPEGDAGAPAASPAPEKVSKPHAPRRKKEVAKDAPVTTDAPAAPVSEPAPAIIETPVSQEKPRPERRQKKNNKGAKPVQEAVAPAPQPLAEQNAPAPAPAPREELDIPEPPAEFRKPDPVPGFAMPEVVGGNEGGGNSRRKRRRNRNRNREDNNRDQQQGQNTPKVDPDELNRRAWKIFLGEVTEEGLALMDDRTAAEASRRAFKVAEIFLLEAARHRPAPVAPVEPETAAPSEDAQESAE